MNIQFNEMTEGKTINSTKEFSITKLLNLRVNEETEKLVVKLRNLDYEQSGKILKIENIEKINQVTVGTEEHNNLKYQSHEIYIHTPLDASSLCEDLVITFKKGE